LRRATRLTYAFSVVFAPHCPICHQPVTWVGNAHRPFCSERGRLIDLGAWASERYRIPGRPGVEAEESDPGEDGGSDENGAE